MYEDNTFQAWEEWVSNNIIKKTSEHLIAAPGKHILKFWIVDPGVVLQKVVVQTRDIGDSYLGPPASVIRE